MKLLALLFLSTVASAGTATFTGTVPTQNTDGSAIVGTITYNLYTGAQGTVKPLLVGGLTTPTYIATGLAGGTNICGNMTAVVNGVESALSNEACKLIPFPTPKPPVLTVTAVTAYSPTPALNKYTMVAVGTLKLGTECIENQTVNGLYVVPRSAVKWSGSARPTVVVAKCG